MRRKDEERRRARELRAEGRSLNAIAAELGVAKSSVSVWVRDMPRPSGPAPLPPGALASRRLPVWRSGVARRCGRCGHLLPIEFFNRLRDGHQWWCRACFRAYFAERGDIHRQQSGKARRARAARARAHILKRLASASCVDCGVADIVVLEFDHVAGKLRDIARLISDGVPLGRIDEEIERCEIVCVNCHRRRTAMRSGWLRADPEWREKIAGRRSRVLENVGLALDALSRSGCVDCGERDLCVLEFDHVGTKRAAVMKLAWNGSRLEDVRREIAECQVRCGNCHRRCTAERGGHYRHAASILARRL
jgi:hypothetical protein